MIGKTTNRRGFISLLVVAASLALLVQIVTMGNLLHRAMALLAAARESRRAISLAEETVWQVDNEALAESGERQAGNMTITWRKEWLAERQGWRIQATVRGFSLGRKWSKSLIAYR